jgi:hypothetical protein
MSNAKNEFLCSCQCNKRPKILFWVHSIFSYLKISQCMRNYYYPNLKAYYTYTFYALILLVTHSHFAHLCRFLTGIVNSWNNLLGFVRFLKVFFSLNKGQVAKTFSLLVWLQFPLMNIKLLEWLNLFYKHENKCELVSACSE